MGAVADLILGLTARKTVKVPPAKKNSTAKAGGEEDGSKGAWFVIYLT